jgi:NADPH:quinone reductase-like Zn-dependent oxidoreductase
VVPNSTRLADLVKLTESGEIPLRVAAVYPFTEAAAAHTHLAQGGVRGAIAIVP